MDPAPTPAIELSPRPKAGLVPSAFLGGLLGGALAGGATLASFLLLGGGNIVRPSPGPEEPRLAPAEASSRTRGISVDPANERIDTLEFAVLECLKRLDALENRTFPEPTPSASFLGAVRDSDPSDTSRALREELAALRTRIDRMDGEGARDRTGSSDTGRRIDSLESKVSEFSHALSRFEDLTHSGPAPKYRDARDVADALDRNQDLLRELDRRVERIERAR